jgi:hypothetical protein
MPMPLQRKNRYAILLRACAIFTFFLLLAATEAKSESPPTFRLESAVFYLPHSGGSLTINIAASHPPMPPVNTRGNGVVPSLMATIYNPEEKVVKDFYWRDEEEKLSTEFLFQQDDAEKGVWQVRLSAPEMAKMSYQLSTNPHIEAAVMPSRCRIWHRDTLNFPDSYFMVPADNTEKLDILINNATLDLFDSRETQILTINKGIGQIALNPGEIYRMKLSTKSPNWNWCGLGGFPVILCKTAQLAKELNASRIKLADGRLVALGFQKRIEEWKTRLRKEDLQLAPYSGEELTHPGLREFGAVLFDYTGPFASAAFLLSIQDIDPDSPLFGSAPHDLGLLSFLHAFNHPGNPYYKNKALLNRLTLFYLDSFVREKHPMKRKFRICENGTISDIHSNYAGADGMRMVPETVAFFLLADDLDAETRELWGEALGYPLRRFFSDRVTCENQSIHWPLKLYMFGKTTGTPLFEQLAENFIKDVANPNLNFHVQTGYLQEAYGPDASYTGLATAMLAFFWRFSKNQQTLQLLDKIYTLMNHTVAPEPDGVIYGSSGFSHRTRAGWNAKQYGGGTRLMAAELDSAACWHRKPEKLALTETEFAKKLRWIDHSSIEFFRENPKYFVYGFEVFGRIWYTFPPIPIRQGAQFPVESAASFDRCFNQQFFFTRRPGYYLTAYTGKTSWKTTHWINRTPESALELWKEKDGVFTIDGQDTFSPLPGLQLFWTPGYGTSLISMNWVMQTHWNTRINLADGTADWPDYWSTMADANPSGGLARIRQSFRKSSAILNRALTYDDNRLTIETEVLEVPAGAEVIEQLPYVLKPGTTIEFHSEGKWSHVPTGSVDAIRWQNSGKAGTMLQFSEPVTVRPGKTFADSRVKITTMDAIAPNGKLKYTLSGF